MKKDIPQLIDLMNSQYLRKRNYAYFQWQYFDAYYPTVLLCAFRGSSLVGMFGMQKRKLKSGANVYQAIDLLVQHEWRGQGILTVLGEKAAGFCKKTDIICVFPNASGKAACERAFGWKTVSRIDSLFLDKKGCMDIPQDQTTTAASVESKHSFEAFSYSSENIAWRFDKHPDYEYSYSRLPTGEFAITKVFRDPLTRDRFGDIVYFQCDLNNTEHLRKLFVRAIISLKEKDIKGITTWALPDIPLNAVLQFMGFVKRQEERYFCVKVLNPKYIDLYNIKSWHLVQSDTEIY
jgi:GNAT superfamily N-acetyltransferase